MMNAAGPPVAIRDGMKLMSTPASIALPPGPPLLLRRGEPLTAPGTPRRTKIWEFNTTLHCSIIGTCLSTGELRQTLKKLCLAPAESTDHELHGTAVTLAGRHDTAAKLLNKALDHRHRVTINQFTKLSGEIEVRAAWRDAVRRGEVPGAYWAALTHPDTTPALIREAFGDVHMLSHLVGSANRADIKRLCQLEAEKAELEAKLERQQLALHQAITTRDEHIRQLNETLAQKIVNQPSVCDADCGDESAVLRQLVADLERRLASETRRRIASEDRLAAAQTVNVQEHSGRLRAEQNCETLQQELDAIETSLVAQGDDTGAETQTLPRLAGITLLYVGGHPHQIAHLRVVAERLGADFLHHDGGVENHTSLLPGLTSRADLVLFPVDCISHAATTTVKQLCRQVGKRFVPLRSASAASLLAALQQLDMTGLADAAD